MHDVALKCPHGFTKTGGEEAVSQATEMMPLRATGVSYQAGGRHLITSLDLEISSPGITMVMGPNGAGKSLLLRLIHGLIQPTAGAISWGGKPVGPDVQRHQALVFQKPVLLRRSVADNVDFALQINGKPDPDRRNALLEKVGLLALANQPARRLSGGEQQRLALARALITEPKVLLLDEPTASLDPASVMTIEQIVREAGSNATKVIFVSHDIAQSRRLADDVVFMHQGRVAEHATAETFFNSASSQAARDFIAGRIVL